MDLQRKHGSSGLISKLALDLQDIYSSLAAPAFQ